MNREEGWKTECPFSSGSRFYTLLILLHLRYAKRASRASLSERRAEWRREGGRRERVQTTRGLAKLMQSLEQRGLCNRPTDQEQRRRMGIFWTYGHNLNSWIDKGDYLR